MRHSYTNKHSRTQYSVLIIKRKKGAEKKTRRKVILQTYISLSFDVCPCPIVQLNAQKWSGLLMYCMNSFWIAELWTRDSQHTHKENDSSSIHTLYENSYAYTRQTDNNAFLPMQPRQRCCLTWSLRAFDSKKMLKSSENCRWKIFLIG